MIDRAPLTLLIAARVLTGALVELPAANRIPVGLGGRVALWFQYTRGAGVGTLIVRPERAAEAPDVTITGITRWSAFPALDGSSFAAGRVNAYPMEFEFQPTLPGPTWYSIGDLDVTDASHLRLLLADSDGGSPGTVDVYYRVTVGQ